MIFMVAGDNHDVAFPSFDAMRKFGFDAFVLAGRRIRPKKAQGLSRHETSTAYPLSMTGSWSG
jgi:hypothetical protein